MRKILVAVPLKGELPSFFVRNLFDAFRRGVPEAELTFSFLEGAPVHQARNEIADHARKGGFDEVVMIDKDLHVTADDFVRLVSHEDALVVAALYPHRSLDTFWHVQAWSKDETPDDAGLLRVKQCAIGFSKIRVEVFERLEKDNSDRIGILTDTGGGEKTICEFFPTELIGPNTPRGRLNTILELLKEMEATDWKLSSVRTLSEKICAIANGSTLAAISEHNLHTAEDYGFCRLCRASNIPIMVDTHLIVQHETSFPMPISSAQLHKMLKEAWRG